MRRLDLVGTSRCDGTLRRLRALEKRRTSRKRSLNKSWVLQSMQRTELRESIYRFDILLVSDHLKPLPLQRGEATCNMRNIQGNIAGQLVLQVGSMDRCLRISENVRVAAFCGRVVRVYACRFSGEWAVVTSNNKNDNDRLKRARKKSKKKKETWGVADSE